MQFFQKLCPFCKKDNQCDVKNAKSCWCMHIKVPEELKLLVPKENKMKTCICKNCILEYKENADKFKEKYIKDNQ
ncbi:MAG: cysteine-rich CWC family protein [Poseidonibacter sp.]|uniref:cysteine-rich CWC family protein n=1 Tax=Poseidonibacter sp. TaxID=2321188 RepID=UPI00359CF85F